VFVLGLLLVIAYGPVNAFLVSYALVSIPVGLIAVRRARLDDALTE